MKKLLMVGDAGCQTGFARVLKGVADRLHASGEYEVVVRAINYQDNHGIDYPYEVEPISYGSVDPTGIHVLGEHIEAIKPDALWVLQDAWHVAGYAREKPKELPTVLYLPVDTPAIKWDFAMALGAFSDVATYTQFGALEMAAALQEGLDIVIEETKGRVPLEGQARWISFPKERRNLDVRPDRLARYQNPGAYSVIPHGLDKDRFVVRDKAQCRREFGISEGAFVVGCVAGNFSRKRLDLVIRAFAVFAATRPNALLAIHCYGGDGDGWDLAHISRYYGVHDKTLAIHWGYETLDEEQMVSLYNCFDAHINMSGGEGWGLPCVESAACGVPQVVPNWAATREIWQGSGLLVDIEGWRHETKYLNTAHANCSVTSAAAHLALLHDDPETRATYAARALRRAEAMPTWDEVGDAFAHLIERASNEGEPEPTSLADILASRISPVRSECR